MDLWIATTVLCYFLVGYLLTDLLISKMDKKDHDHLWVTRIVGTVVWPYVVVTALLFAPRNRGDR